MGVAFTVALLFVLLAASPACTKPSAENILDASGIKGGLVVQIGCGDGRLTAALRANDSFLVQGIDTDPTNVVRARGYIQSLGLSGKVSVSVFDGQNLPYADQLVNLLVISDPSSVDKEELLRVLCPGGVALTTGNGGQSIADKLVKPWPEEIDEWTHYLHGPDNNTVAEDSRVGPPQHFQWISGPRFSRSHDHLASVSAVVSSGGRLFSIIDEGAIAFAGASPKWRLVARDAFSGVWLWEREIANWEYHLRDFRSGPANISRRLVAVGDRVYVTLGYGRPVVALDAATGASVHSYSNTEGTREILYYQGTLLLVLGESKTEWGAQKAKQIVSQEGYSPPFEKFTPPADNMRVMAIDAETGEMKWESSQPYTRQLMPSTLAASAGHVYFQNTDAVVCLDAATGQQKWAQPRGMHRSRLAWSTPTLVVYDGVVYSADRRAEEPESELQWLPSGGYHEYIRGEGVRGELIAFNAETGERLWSCPAYEGFNAPVDVMISDGLLWTGRYAWGEDPGFTEARDPKTGEVLRQRPPDQEFLPRTGHARCHRAKATSEFLILGRRGVEFVDLQTGGMVANFWLRGICQFGVMPANGLLYVPPHSCACSVDDMLKSGFMALAPRREIESRTEEGQEPTSKNRLVKGPAFGSFERLKSESWDANSGGWPTYRHDRARSGVTPNAVSQDLQLVWETKIGESLTSSVIDEGILLTARKDAHYIHALEATTGRESWTFAAGGRIDSPPTIYRGRVLFGSADGWVYCLRLRDGELAWKFRAAPLSHQIVVDEQLESPWPVSGSVLVLDGAGYFAAGRTSYLEGGMFLYKLDVETGQELRVSRLEVEPERRDGGVASGGHLSDILSSVGDSIFMRSARFDLDLASQKENVPHLWSSVGFLDETWWHRTYWQVGTWMDSGWGRWPKAGQRVPAGRLLVTDGPRVFGFGRNQYDTPGAHVGVDADGVWGPIGREQGRWTYYRLFRQSVNLQAQEEWAKTKNAASPKKIDWTRRLPVLGQAMVLADETLFISGPPDPLEEIPHDPADVDPLAEALETKRGGRLLAISATDGKTLAEHELTSPPIFDGMAAASGYLYLTTKVGTVICLGPRR